LISLSDCIVCTVETDRYTNSKFTTKKMPDNIGPPISKSNWFIYSWLNKGLKIEITPFSTSIVLFYLNLIFEWRARWKQTKT